MRPAVSHANRARAPCTAPGCRADEEAAVQADLRPSGGLGLPLDDGVEEMFNPLRDRQADR